MSITVIPLPTGTPFFSQETSLEGVNYRLTFQYSQREDVYYLSIGDPAATADVVSAMKVFCNKGLIRRWSGVGTPWPPGELVAISKTQDQSPARLNDLGDRVSLLYISSDDSALVGK